MSHKVIAMIPARLGSKRVPKKNLRLLGDKPLISYAIETAIASKVFDEIYVNTESDEIGAVAEHFGAKYYKRNESLADDNANNDQFLEDFCQNVESDYVVQILPTSPFISTDEMAAFVKEMTGQGLDTLVSVAEHQIACVFDDTPINFSKLEPHISSQLMKPVQSYATVLMGYKKEKFLRDISHFGFGYHGADGNVGYFPLKGFSLIDIDNEEDFKLAEVVLDYLNRGADCAEPKYFDTSLLNKNVEAMRSEADVPSILKIDGVAQSDFEHENQPIVHIPHLIADKDSTLSWCHRLVNTESNSATLISQLPGEGNRRHFHPDWNEWWYIVSGEWIWEIEGKNHRVKQGDFVFIEKNKVHKITAAGDKPAIRLAVSRADVAHVYPDLLD
jgi:CMP-N-acetylneuraminic acid synthetase/quercetin dioxygenase-like cupin family protein